METSPVTKRPAVRWEKTQPVALKVGERTLHRVGIDARLHRKLAHRGQTLAGAEFARDDGLRQALRELGVDGAVIAELPLHTVPPFLDV